MTDLVDRLRYKADELASSQHAYGDAVLYQEAADEIERLRKTLREIVDSSNDPRAVREARAALGGKP